MSPNPHVSVQIDLSRIRRNAEAILAETRVPLIAVVKADAYGLGAEQVAATLADLVDAFYVFDAVEALRHRLHDITAKRTIALLAESNDPADYLPHRIHPAVWTKERALLLQQTQPLLSIDAGQGRFGCPPDQIREILDTGAISEAFTHAATPAQLSNFQQIVEQQLNPFRPALRIHAAGTALLHNQSARYDALRVGLALYAGAAHVSARLIEVHDGNAPRGYTGFNVPRYGVIRCGYSNNLRPGPCLINGAPQRILEVGMQSAFVELAPHDRPGDPVTLLGNGLTEQDLSAAWKCTPHEVLLRLCAAGLRTYPSPTLSPA